MTLLEFTRFLAVVATVTGVYGAVGFLLAKHVEAEG